MSPQVQKLLDEALALSEEDRLELADCLYGTIEPDGAETYEQAWAHEISKRIADLDSGAVKAVPWEEVRRRLLATRDESTQT